MPRFDLNICWESVMPNESNTRSEVVTKTFRVFRYAVGVTLALTIVLLIIDVLSHLGGGPNVNVYLSQSVLITSDGKSGRQHGAARVTECYALPFVGLISLTSPSKRRSGAPNHVG
jgi:hypothetical protein